MKHVDKKKYYYKLKFESFGVSTPGWETVV